MHENEIEKRTIILEDTDLYTRIRTQCNDQNYVRDYYMGQVSMGAAIAACAYLLDMLMDMGLKSLQVLEDNNMTNFTPEQKANFERLKLFNLLLGSTDLQRNTWEMDWVYVDVKHQQDLLGIQFFEKRQELQLGIPLPSPIPNPVPDI